MNTLISYYGGKQRIASKILPHFPAHSVYCEPFAGGAALLYKKPIIEVSNNNHYREVLNDTSDLLINMYRYARNNMSEFIEMMEMTLYSKSEHSHAVHICKNPEGYSDKEKAWAYYVNINMSFSSKLSAGWGRNKIGYNAALTFARKIENLPESIDRLRNVYIESTDAIDCIKKWDSPHTLFYVDPPYPGTNLGHYGGYTMDDYRELCETLDNIQGSYVLSNYPQDVSPKSAQKIVEIQAANFSSGKGKVNRKTITKPTAEELGDRKRTEVLWICDRSKNARKSLAPILAKNIGLWQDQMSLFEETQPDSAVDV